eukprot:CFRG5522T1
MWRIALLSIALKLLLLDTYRSTDFEVHRNWLAITYSRPLSEWYYEDTSEWTLDYPPLFAWFEYLLSCLAVFWDPSMLEVENLNYASRPTVLFQRLSVVTTDLVLFYAVLQYTSTFNSSLRQRIACVGLVVLNCGLLILDHIHFQYNGILLGLLILSLARIQQERVLEGAFIYTVLLNMKHLYLGLAPAFGIYLLQNYCFVDLKGFSVRRFCALGVIVIATTALSFGPFVVFQSSALSLDSVANPLSQLMSRLFPFHRGLVHAYWAPNVWALYSALDMVLAYVFKLCFPSFINNANARSMTSGVVGEAEFHVMPQIPPIVTVICVLLALMPCLFGLWFAMRAMKPKLGTRCLRHDMFVRTVALCGLTMFLFGWHVHEKAILTGLLPVILLAIRNPNLRKVCLILSVSGIYALFPLFCEEREAPIKVCLLLLYIGYSYLTFGSLSNPAPDENLPGLSLPMFTLEWIYIAGFVPLQLYVGFGHSLVFCDGMEFLPLLLTSVYCSIGIVYAYVYVYVDSIIVFAGAMKDSGDVASKSAKKTQ